MGRQTAGIGIGRGRPRDPDGPLAVRQPGVETSARGFHRARPVPDHSRAHHQLEGGAGLRFRGHEDHEFAVLAVSRFHGGGEAAPGDLEALVGPVHGADAGADHFRAFLPLPDERFRQMALFEVAVPLEAEVHREPVGEQDVAQHATAVPGVPAGLEALLNGVVFGDVPDRCVVFGVPVRPVGGGITGGGSRIGLGRDARNGQGRAETRHEAHCGSIVHGWFRAPLVSARPSIPRLRSGRVAIGMGFPLSPSVRSTAGDLLAALGSLPREHNP